MSQEKLLKYQERELIPREEVADPESAPNYVVDECGLLRHKILLNCYFVRPKRNEYFVTPEESRLFSTLPPPQGCFDEDSIALTEEKEVEEEEAEDDSELAVWLRDCGPGLRDGNWVSYTRKAHKASPKPLKVIPTF